MAQQKIRTRYGTVTVSFTALGLMLGAHTAFAQATIYVDQDGLSTATATATSAGTDIVLDEFSLTGTLGNSYDISKIPAPNTNSSTFLVDSGSATSDGDLNYVNGYLSFAGYDSTVGTASVVNSGAARGVAVINIDSATPSSPASVDLSTSLTTAYAGSSNNIRSAVTADGHNIYTAGVGGGTTTATTTGGIQETTDGSSSASSIESPVSGKTSVNARVVEDVGRTIYFSTGSTTGVGGGTGIYSLGTVAAGSGTTTAQAPVLVAADASKSPYDFAFYTATGQNTGNIISDLYVADDSVGILKYTSTNGGAYSLSTQSVAITSVTGISVDPLTGTIYGVTDGASGNSELFSVATANGTSLATPSVLFTASSQDYNFRGLTVVDAAAANIAAPAATSAAPEPSEWAALAFTGIGIGGLLLRARRRIFQPTESA